jgi:hypothetical protein
MDVLVLIMALLLPLAMAAAFLLGRYRRRPLPAELSAVTRQHLELFQGGQLSETAVASAKDRLRGLLEHGETAAVEASLRPGTTYLIQVRALAEIGTDDAGQILERQLQRRLSSDQVEQSWYWIDLACGLRTLQREQSMPHLLRCADRAADAPLSHFLAAETVCFLSFSGYLRQVETPLGQAALRVLHRALEGLRLGVQPQIVAEARLGEVIEGLWDHRPESVHPLVVRVFHEALRQVRRAPHLEILLAEETGELEAYHWQLSRLQALETALTDYLADAGPDLAVSLARAEPADQPDILQALVDLHADAGAVLLRLLPEGRCPHAALVVDALARSTDPRVGPFLRNWVCRQVPMDRRALKRRRAGSPRRGSVPASMPYPAILRALRGHPSAETESFLLLAAQDWDPAIRLAALGSLGWWEPCDRAGVLSVLHEGRRDPSGEVRQSARAALARLGERQALHWFRQALAAEDAPSIHEAIQVVVNEGLTFLWPDLDRLADASERDIAYHAREGLERLSEEHISRPG